MVWNRGLLVLCFSFGVTSSCLGAEADATSPQLPCKAKFHLFLLAGQSNMAGRGKVAEEDTVPHPRVLTLNKENQWEPAVDPIHFDKSIAGVGVGRTFAITLAERDPSITIGLIPCAAGGSPISSWEPGGSHAQTKSHPYDDAIKRTRIVLQQGTLQGILWHQGESDSHDDLPTVYEEKLRAMIERFRAEFDAAELPFLAGQLGRFPDRPWDEAREAVNSVHKSLPQKVENTAFVPSTGLSHKGDKVHFDSKSLREFGGRYAEAYLTLVEKHATPCRPIFRRKGWWSRLRVKSTWRKMQTHAL